MSAKLRKRHRVTVHLSRGSSYPEWSLGFFTQKHYFCHMRDIREEDKVNYEAPAILVLELKTEGLVCQSAERDGYSDAIEI